jgi:hypothetical protein
MATWDGETRTATPSQSFGTDEITPDYLDPTTLSHTSGGYFGCPGNLVPETCPGNRKL